MPKHLESKLQQSCVKWFDLQYSGIKQLLFAIPNGGNRGKVEAGILKGEGVRSGVADLFLSIAIDHESVGHKYQGSHGLYIEMKFGKGKQNDNQKAFQKSVTTQGYSYEVISDFDSFKKLIDEYLR